MVWYHGNRLNAFSTLKSLGVFESVVPWPNCLLSSPRLTKLYLFGTVNVPLQAVHYFESS